MGALPPGEVREYWEWRYNPLSEKMQAIYREPLLNRISVFVVDPSIRLMVGQTKSTSTCGKSWTRPVALGQLKQRKLKSNAFLLGSLLIANCSWLPCRGSISQKGSAGLTLYSSMNSKIS